MSLIVNRIVNAPIASNCYIISMEKRSDCIIVDPGSEDVSLLIEQLNKLQLIPAYIVLTHEHFDHIWSVNYLKKMFRCHLVCSEACYLRICREKDNLSFYFDQRGFVVDYCEYIDIVDDLLWNDKIFHFIATPGHSVGSICMMIENYLFSGDTMIYDNKTVIKLPTGNIKALKKSFELIYSQCPLDTLVNPGHGDPFLLSDYVVKR